MKYILSLLLFINTAYSCSTKVSTRFEAFLTRFEGISVKVYNDHRVKVERGLNGFLTPLTGSLHIGIGHKLTKKEISSGWVEIGGRWVSLHGELTKDEISILLSQDLARSQRIVRKNVKICLKPHQFDALTSFVFNLGYKAFYTRGKRNGVLSAVNSKQYRRFYREIAKYKLSGKKVLKGLIKRRTAEIKLFKSRNYGK